jgi:hypothetical protein
MSVRAEEYSERQLEIAGWPIRLTTYRLGETFHCKVDNVSPGAWVARASGSTREQAEQEAIAIAQRRLLRTRRVPTTFSNSEH